MQSIAFQRNGRTIIAQVYNRYLEPQGNKYLEVLFCEDASGSRYRVLRSEVLVMGRKKQVKAKKKGKKARMVG